MGSETELLLNHSCMNIKHRKCAILHGQKSGNNRYLSNGTSTIHIDQGDEIPKIDISGKHQFFRHDTSLDGKSNQSQGADNTLVYQFWSKSIRFCIHL